MCVIFSGNLGNRILISKVVPKSNFKDLKGLFLEY